MRPPRRVNLATHRIPPHVIDLADPHFVRRTRVLPILELGDVLLVACANPTERQDLKGIEEYFDRMVRWVVADIADIENAIAQHYPD